MSVGPLLVCVTKSGSHFNLYSTPIVNLLEGHISSLANAPSSNFGGGLNHCRREGMRTIEEQAGGNLFRSGQRKKRLTVIKRERTGMGKAGH